MVQLVTLSHPHPVHRRSPKSINQSSNSKLMGLSLSTKSVVWTYSWCNGTYILRLVCINFLDKESWPFMISYFPYSLFSAPSLVLALKLCSRQVPKSIFNQTSIFLFFFTGKNYFLLQSADQQVYAQKFWLFVCLSQTLIFPVCLFMSAYNNFWQLLTAS